jgi:glycosyltransferase involved in cell wall biosynthesis
MALNLIYLVTEDWYFVSHRLPMARAAKRAGFEVHVATHVANHAAAIEREGFVLHPLAWQRGRLDPLHLAATVMQVRRLYRSVQPWIAHHVALAPTIVGSLAAAGLNFPCLNALAGMGFVFTSQDAKARAIRPMLTTILRRALRRPYATALVQNPDDRKALEAIGIAREKIALIPGSGVDTDKLQPLPEPPPPITIGFVGRLLHDKGVAALMEAHRLLQSRGRNFELLIAGDADPANPASIPEAELAGWKQREHVTFLGHIADVRDVWRKAHIAVLPSRREGLPLSLLEAAACGRPLVATDVPGCREIARPNVNALLVAPEDPAALADAIAQLADNADLRQRFGAAGRQVVEAEFSSTKIGDDIVALYRSLLTIPPGPLRSFPRPAGWS